MGIATQTGGRPATTGIIPGRYALSVGKPNIIAPLGWQWVLLTDVARLESGHTPSRKHPEYWGGNVPWIGIKDATENHGRTIDDTFQHTNDLGIANSSARILPKNTVCLSRTASVGYVVVMGRPMATSQDFVNWVCSDAIDYQFLKAVLLAERESFSRFSSGTTHQTIYFPEVKAFHICLPPLAEQHAIADILSSLDNKIELNRRMNETLEDTACTIFKSWFVNFDPVHAKLRGEQPPGMDAATATLFPDHFEESELGSIPAGWRVEPLSNHVISRRGLSYKGDGLVDATIGLPMHNLNSVYEGGGYKYEGMKYYSGEYQERHIAKAGDVIVANTEQGHNLLLIGYPAIIPQKYDEALYSHHLYRVIPHEDSYITPRFIYYLFKTGIFHETIAGYTNGTTVNMLPADGLEKPLFVMPSSEVIKSFDELVVPMLNIMEQNHEQTQQLAETRDALLPKLVSGEVRVAEVDTYMESIA